MIGWMEGWMRGWLGGEGVAGCGRVWCGRVGGVEKEGRGKWRRGTHFLIRAMLNRRAMSRPNVQYFSALFEISSDDQRNLTRVMSIPAAVHTYNTYGRRATDRLSSRLGPLPATCARRLPACPD